LGRQSGRGCANGRSDLNLGGEGEIREALNQQGVWIFPATWFTSREGKSLSASIADGVQYVVSDNRILQFADESVDEVFTNGVPIDGHDTFLGSSVQSREIRRILKLEAIDELAVLNAHYFRAIRDSLPTR
jgi:hypothetical protein